MEKDVEALKEQSDTWQRRIDDIINIIEDLEGDLAQLEDPYSTVKANIADLAKDLSELNNENDALEGSKTNVTVELTAIKTKDISSLKQKIANIKAGITAAGTNASSLSSKNVALQK